jgi:hypothetical protein
MQVLRLQEQWEQVSADSGQQQQQQLQQHQEGREAAGRFVPET